MIFKLHKKGTPEITEDPEALEQEQLRRMNLPKTFEVETSSLSKATRAVYRRGVQDDLLDDLRRNAKIEVKKVKTGSWL